MSNAASQGPPVIVLLRVPQYTPLWLIGGEPRTQWLPEAIQLERGYILTGRDVVRTGAHPSRWPLDRAPLPLETSMPGVFAAGDARYRSIKRVASAVGEGATAVRLAHEYLVAEHMDELVQRPADDQRTTTALTGAADRPDLLGTG